MKGEKISFIVLPDSLLRTRLDMLLLVVIVYTGLFVPTSFEGRVCVKRVPDDTPICPARPRTPPEQGELSSDVQETWARYFAENGISVEEVVSEAWAADGDASSTTSSSSYGSESSRLE